MRFGKALILMAIAATGPSLWAPQLATAEVTGKTLEISQLVLDENGDPSLVAEGITYGGQKMLWQRCDESLASCIDLQTHDSFLDPGETPPGTVFTARFLSKPNGEIVRSPVWQGRVTALNVPTLAQPIVAGSLVDPIGATWTGGWGIEYSDYIVYACRRPDSKSCQFVEEVSTTGWPSRKLQHIGAYYSGWGLYVTDNRYTTDTAFTMIGLGPTRTNPSLHPNQTTQVSAFLGPIESRPDLWAVVPKSVNATRRSIALAHVRCPDRCVAKLSLASSQGTYIRQYPTKIDKSGWLRVPAKPFRGLKALHVSVYIDGALATKQRTRLTRH